MLRCGAAMELPARRIYAFLLLMRKIFNTANSSEPLTLARLARKLNFYTEDRFLQNMLEREDSAFLARHSGRFEATGAFVADELDRQASDNDVQNRTVLNGTTVQVHKEYEAAHQKAYELGAIAPAFVRGEGKKGARGARKERHLLPFVMGYMLSKSDISVHCPVTMTGAVAYILDQFAPESVRDAYLPELLRQDGKTSTGGTWATESHSGSDVGRTTTIARPLTGITAAKEENAFSLTGLKWFASNATSQIAVATARPQDANGNVQSGGKGLGLYLVPSHKPDGSRNSYRVDRLKEKMGTKGLPTGEIELEGAFALEIAPPPHGLRLMMEALGYSRVHNAMAAAGVMHRAYIEASLWAQHRETFGAPLSSRPMIQKRLLDIEMHWKAGTALAFEAAKAFDKCADTGDQPTDDKIWMRIITALAKYKTAEQSVDCAQKALTLIGGNGYTEDFATSRLMRDAMVLSVWEGPEQIQARELMGMLTYDGGRGSRVLLKRLGQHIKALPQGKARNVAQEALDTIMQADIPLLMKKPQLADYHADELMHKMALLSELVFLHAQGDWDKRFKAQRRTNELAMRFASHYESELTCKLSARPDPMLRVR